MGRTKRDEQSSAPIRMVTAGPCDVSLADIDPNVSDPGEEIANAGADAASNVQNAIGPGVG
jgi:hypothetical protein